MSGQWHHNNRRQLPPDWAARRRAVRERAGDQCEAVENGTRCTRQGSECDHAVHRDDHRIESLQWLCSDHHTEKTQAEARAASQAIRAKGKHPMSR